MSFRFSRLKIGVLVVAAVVLMCGHSWAVFYPLGPSKDEWGLKYDVEVTAAGGDKLNVLFTLNDQGRLAPIHWASVVAFSDTRRDGSRAYLLNAQIDLKSTEDGKLTGQVQIPEKLADRAMIRLLTMTIVSRQQKTDGAGSYVIPLKTFLKKDPVAASPKSSSSIASPPASKVAR